MLYKINKYNIVKLMSMQTILNENIELAFLIFERI